MNIEQKIARLALTRVDFPEYVDAGDRTRLGESDYGTLMAPQQGSPDWWEPFDFRKPGHWAAWNTTRRDGKIAFLDLEGN
jgi:hypothetical protein